MSVIIKDQSQQQEENQVIGRCIHKKQVGLPDLDGNVSFCCEKLDWLVSNGCSCESEVIEEIPVRFDTGIHNNECYIKSTKVGFAYAGDDGVETEQTIYLSRKELFTHILDLIKIWKKM